jgi:hypothetical protein
MKITYISISLLILIMVFGCSEIDKSFQEPLPDIVTYDSHIKAILDQSCVRCHGGDETQGINLSSYSNINTDIGNDVSSFWIVPGNPNSRILIDKLNPGQNDNMYGYLINNRDYKMIYQWIVIDSVAEN